MSRIGARRWAAVALAAALATGCSLGERQERADRVADAVSASLAEPALGGTITAELSVEVTRPEAYVGSGVTVIGDTGTTVRYQIARDAELALLGPTAGNEAFPLVVFDAERIYLRRPESLEDARPWFELDRRDLVEGDGVLEETTFESGITAAVVSVLDPRLFLGLASSPLAGSIEEVGRRTVDDVDTTRYDANFDIPGALDARFDDEAAEDAELFLSLLAITDDVHPGSVWLDDDGGVRKVALTLEMDVHRFLVFHLRVEMTVSTDVSPDPDLAVPATTETVIVSSLIPLERSAASSAPTPTDLVEGLLNG